MHATLMSYISIIFSMRYQARGSYSNSLLWIYHIIYSDIQRIWEGNYDYYAAQYVRIVLP